MKVCVVMRFLILNHVVDGPVATNKTFNLYFVYKERLDYCKFFVLQTPHHSAVTINAVAFNWKCWRSWIIKKKNLLALYILSQQLTASTKNCSKDKKLFIWYTYGIWLIANNWSHFNLFSYQCTNHFETFIPFTLEVLEELSKNLLLKFVWLVDCNHRRMLAKKITINRYLWTCIPKWTCMQSQPIPCKAQYVRSRNWNGQCCHLLVCGHWWRLNIIYFVVKRCYLPKSWNFICRFIIRIAIFFFFFFSIMKLH